MISHKAIVDAGARHPDAAAALHNWYRITKRATWRSLVETRNDFAHADAVRRFTVFNIKGNRYRLICWINYANQKVFVRHFLTHREYDKEAWTV